MSKSLSTNIPETKLDSLRRLMPIGAEQQLNADGVHFRLWAPESHSVKVLSDGSFTETQLRSEGNGYFSGYVSDAKSGSKYKYELDANGEAYPDPASRYQPTGPHGYSEIIDPQQFKWTDHAWPGVRLFGQVIYELHLGTFTPEGTWKSAAEKLPYLRDTGVTLIEVMPVAEFPGKYGWGYDGVLPYAPAQLYGAPDDMRSFVDQAHAIGLGVILDVVYNHLGPEGNYLPKFSPFYLTVKYKTDWGQAINFDGDGSGAVREFFCENAAYWIREFHLDGLRLDATQDVHDQSQPHVLVEIGQAARAAAGTRSIVLIGENEPQDTQLIKPTAEGGYGLDALWNDDYHHTAMVALTGKSDAYYTDYRGSPQEFVSALKYGFLYQGQWYRWQKKRRGSSNLGLPRPATVTFIQNHDQIANSARGQRVQQVTSPGLYKALTVLTLLGPATPMLFQGQEFASSNPFLFFADHKPELARLIRLGRVEFLEQWRSLQMPDMRKCLSDPCSEDTFERSKLDFAEVVKHSEMYALHQDLLKLRRADPVISRQGEHGIDGAVLSASTFVIRYFSADYRNDRLLMVNLGKDLDFDPAPEPLLAPPVHSRWQTLWSSDDARYGGCGTAPLDSEENWKIPGQAAVVLYPLPIAE